MLAETMKVKHSKWTRQHIKIKGKPFSFKGREYLKQVYDSPYPKRFLKCARQVEKTQAIDSRNLMADGSWKRAGDIVVGDEIVSYDENTNKLVAGKVSWISKPYAKECRRIITALGHEPILGVTHPVRMFGKWELTSNLKPGDRVASVRSAGLFGNLDIPDDRIRITAFLIGDGHMTRTVGFTHLPGPVLDDFTDAMKAAENSYAVAKSGPNAKIVRVHVGPVHKWLLEDRLRGKKSATKFVPAWVFKLTRGKTALFLNRLWSTDGHVKKNGPSKYSVEYCSISRRLIKDVQSLLWKFGIPSTIRKNLPNIYKRRGEEKYAYILRIVTAEGVRRFLGEIGALGKSENVPMPDAVENNNRDTLPIEANEIIRTMFPLVRTGRPIAGAPIVPSLTRSGLLLTLGYAPTYGKVAAYLCLAAELGRESSALQAVHSQDIYWDRVKRIEDVGIQECIDFTVEGTHSYIVDGIVTHNSSTLCNIGIAELYCTPYTNSIYVSSSQAQTSVFSTGYVKQTLMDSPSLRGSWYKPGSSVYTDKIYEKQFTNHSRMYFRYAFLTADRVRGIGAQGLKIDEIQDILTKNIPIMEECTSHYMASRWWIYSGTPKTYENAIEHYWKRTTQKEWVVKCFGCNHWNVLGEANVLEKGLSCERCKKLIDHRNGQWARFGQKDAEFDGFRISQLMVSWSVWKEIWIKYKRYPRQQFYNEVLGLSCEHSSSLLSQMDLMRACANPGFAMYLSRPTDRYYQSLHSGVDWGAGQGSLTVHVIGGIHAGRFEVIYMKKYDPSKMDTQEIVQDIAKVNYRFKVMRCGADWGFGFMQNQELQKAHRAIQVWRFYSSATQKAMCTYNKKAGHFVINRNGVIADLINGIKRGSVGFFRWREFEAFSKDFLGLFQDVTHTRMLYYNHPADVPDDAVHATNYARTCALLYARLLTPGRSEMIQN